MVSIFRLLSGTGPTLTDGSFTLSESGSGTVMGTDAIFLFKAWLASFQVFRGYQQSAWTFMCTSSSSVPHSSVVQDDLYRGISSD